MLLELVGVLNGESDHFLKKTILNTLAPLQHTFYSESMPPKRKADATAVSTTSAKSTRTAGAAAKATSVDDKKNNDSQAKKDTRPAAVIEAEEIADQRAAAMGLEGDMRTKYFAKPRNKKSDDNDEDDDDNGGGELTTREDFARCWCLVTSDKWVDVIGKMSDDFLKITGNEPADMFLMFNTHSGNVAIEFIGEKARRCARLVKSNPPQAFWELIGLIETMLSYTSFMFDNDFDPEEFAVPMRELAAACRAVLRTPLASMKVDEINMNVFKLLRDQIARRLQEDSNLAGSGIKIKWS
jgi:hypothetical protein